MTRTRVHKLCIWWRSGTGSAVVEPVDVHARLKTLRVDAAHELGASRIIAELAARGEGSQPLSEMIHLRRLQVHFYIDL